MTATTTTTRTEAHTPAWLRYVSLCGTLGAAAIGIGISFDTLSNYIASLGYTETVAKSTAIVIDGTMVGGLLTSLFGTGWAAKVRLYGGLAVTLAVNVTAGFAIGGPVAAGIGAIAPVAVFLAEREWSQNHITLEREIEIPVADAHTPSHPPLERYAQQVRDEGAGVPTIREIAERFELSTWHARKVRKLAKTG